MMRTWFIILASILLLVAACSAEPEPEPTSVPPTEAPTQPPATVAPTQPPPPTEAPADTTFESPPELANPASVFCADQGYELEIRDEAAVQVGSCIFPDGTECEEWAFFNGDCAPGGSSRDTTFESPIGMPNPASVFCTEQGYELEIRDEAAGQAGYCIFPDGSECEEWAYFRGECKPGSQ
jgi:putative hemolysin